MVKNILLVVVFAAVGVWASIWMGSIWTENVISQFTFRNTPGTVLMVILIWVPAFSIFLFLGAGFTALTKSSALFWPLVLGLAASSYAFSLRQVIPVSEPSFESMVVGYSDVLAPLVASILGWWLFCRANNSFKFAFGGIHPCGRAP